MLRFIKKFVRRVYKKTTRPLVLRKKIVSSNKPPRMPEKDCNMLHSFTGNSESIFEQIINNREELFAGINKNSKVLIKINLNTAHDYPASTDNAILGFLLDCLIDMGIDNITVGDCSSISVLPTKRVFNKKRLYNITKGKADIVFFDESEWVNVEIDGEYLQSITLPQSVYTVDKIIYLSNIKTHKHAGVSMGIKSAIGLMHPLERIGLHRESINEKIAETALAIQPDLIILDGRKVFIDGGPTIGTVAVGNTVIIGNNLLDTDIAGYNLLYNMKRDMNILGEFPENPFDMPQLHHARRILGGNR